MKVEAKTDGHDAPTKLEESLLDDVMARLGLDVPAGGNAAPKPEQKPVERLTGEPKVEPVEGEDEAVVAAAATSETVTPESDEEKQARLDAKSQERIDKRIGELTAKAKTNEDRAAVAEAKLAEITTKLERVSSQAAGKTLGLHPLLMAESEETIEKWEQSADEFEDFALEHGDGYEDEKDPSKSMTAGQISALLARLRSERARIVPKARERLNRIQHENEAFGKLYPQYVTGAGKGRIDEVLIELPVLKHVANARLIAATILEGRMVQGLRKKKAVVAVPPPVLPKAAVAAEGTRMGKVEKRTMDQAVNGYVNNGGGFSSLQSEVEALMPGMGF